MAQRILTAIRLGHLGYALSSTIIILIGGTLFMTIREVREATASVNRALEVLGAVSALNEAVSRAESAQRGLLIDPSEEFIRDRDTSVDEARNQLRRLRELAQHDPSRQARLQTLSNLLRSRIDAMRRTEAVRQATRMKDVETAAAARLGREISVQLMKAADDLRREELRQLETRQALADRHYRTTDIVLVACIALALLVLLPGYLGFRRESAAREHAQAQLRDVTENVPGAVFQYRVLPDGTARYEFLSSGAAAVRRIDPARALADSRTVTDTIVEEDRSRVFDTLREAAAEGRAVDVDYRVRPVSGEERWIHTAAWPRREPDGSVLYNGHWSDVTDKRHLAIELVAARDAADSANRAKSVFLAAMSHEIRTPMNGVLGMLELLSLTRLDPEQRATLNVVRESGATLLRIIDDILDFSKIEAGKLDLKPEPTSIARLVERIRNVYLGNASSKGLLLRCRIDPNLPPASVVDPVRLQQVIGNLVSNAIKFTDRGEIEMSVALVGAGDTGDRVAFAVRDTGVGINAEQQAQLFAPFTQADSARRRAGTGLGLTISRRLAEMMGGRLVLESAPGVGTRVSMELELPRAEIGPQVEDGPALDMQPAPRAAPSADDAIADGTYILVVDDHPINRMVVHRQVQALGYAAEVAQDGAEALAAFQRKPFAMVITDCNMPEIDGYELARRIRDIQARTGAQRIPIIACTANALGGEAEKCFAAGMDDYLSKPVELRKLAAKLEQWLPLERVSGDSAVFDRAVLDEACGGDPDAAAAVLTAFARHHENDLASLEAAFAARDYASVRRHAHRIRGASATVGAIALSKAATALERLDDAAGPAWALAVGAIRRERDRFHEAARPLGDPDETAASA